MMDATIVIEAMFYLAATVAVLSSIKVIIGNNAIHALLYLIVSLLAVAVCFYFLGAPFAAGLEVIVYAGAILVLFVFAIMMFGLADDESRYAPNPSGRGMWFGPCLLAFILLAELVYVLVNANSYRQTVVNVIDAREVGILLYGPYLLAVEIASLLLLAGLVAGYHFAKSDGPGAHL